MQISLVAFVISSIVLLNQSSPTVEQKLGKDKTESILRKVMSDEVSKASNSYLVANESIDALRYAGVPPFILEEISLGLKDKEIYGKEGFLQAVNEIIGEENTKIYREAILLNTQGYLIIKSDFFNAVLGIVLHTKAPNEGVEIWLEENFRKFLSAHIMYLKGKSRIKNRFSSHEHLLDEFLKIQEAKCGELGCPAGVPPCCGKLCDPCKKQ